MKFEYDENKSSTNLQKHGINFEDAKELWSDQFAIELPSINCEDEARFLVIGEINGRCHTAIITYRNDIIRIISVRKSRDKEIELYESIKHR